MKTICLGGGQVGLSFTINMKLRDPNHLVTMVARNKPDDAGSQGVTGQAVSLSGGKV